MTLNFFTLDSSHSRWKMRIVFHGAKGALLPSAGVSSRFYLHKNITKVISSAICPSRVGFLRRFLFISCVWHFQNHRSNLFRGDKCDKHNAAPQCSFVVICRLVYCYRIFLLNVNTKNKYKIILFYMDALLLWWNSRIVCARRVWRNLILSIPSSVNIKVFCTFSIRLSFGPPSSKSTTLVWAEYRIKLTHRHLFEKW